MITHKVVFEIEVEAENPLEAAKEVQSLLRDNDTDLQFYVQKDGEENTVIVDLSEKEEDPIFEISNYISLITPKGAVDVESILFDFADDHGLLSCKSDIEEFNEWVEENL